MSKLLGHRRALAVLAALIGLIGLTNASDGARIKLKASLAQYLLEQAWDETQESGAGVKPWPWADVWPMARIEVPRLHKSSIVLSGISGQALAFGPGLMAQSPQPGRPGLSVIAAHRDTHFRFLKDIEIGDAITLTQADGTRLTYAVRETHIVPGYERLNTDVEGEQIALVTCWPFTDTARATFRFIAIAKRVDQPPGAPTSTDRPAASIASASTSASPI